MQGYLPLLEGTTEDALATLYDVFCRLECVPPLPTSRGIASYLTTETVAVFPCSFKVLPHSMFRAADPIILSVEILAGQLRIGTPVFTLREDFSVQQVGTVVGVEKEHTAVVVSRAGMQVGVKIQPKETSMTMGRHVSETATFHSFVTRDSIDALKASFREEMTTEDWKLVIELKKMLSII